MEAVDKVTDILVKARELYDLIIPLNAQELRELDERANAMTNTSRKDMFVAISNIARFEWLCKVLS